LAGNFTNQFESQSMNTLGLQGMQSTEGVSPPGTTPTKIGKKKGKK